MATKRKKAKRKALQKYESHKTVRAFKTSEIRRTLRGVILQSSEGHEVEVSKSYLDKHDPKVGGYYVRYEDGYESWSPAEAFEDGYHKAKKARKKEVGNSTIEGSAMAAYEIYRKMFPKGKLRKKPYPDATTFFNDPEYADVATKWLESAENTKLK